ncbi:MAG: hypothetical protein AB1631_17180, partial [Acidobacteriota bacterium]
EYRRRLNMNMIMQNQHSEFSQGTDSKRRLPLSRTWIAFLLLIAAIALPSLPAFSDDKPRAAKKDAVFAPANAQTKDSKEDQEIDVVPMVRNKKFREGLNPVYTGKGLKLSARVKDGKIDNWVVTDSNGKELPSTYARSVRYCRICVTVNGVRVCLIVPCKGTIVIIIRTQVKQA